MSKVQSNKITRAFWELHGDNTGQTAGCSEPGYDDKPVILANWNDIDSLYFDALEKAGYSCEWEDEWIECGECYKAFRISGNSYSWEMYGYIGDGEAICGNCIDWDEYLESMENQPKKALTCSLFYKHEDEVASRYTLIKEGFENGLHEGMNDNPSTILARLLENDKSGRYIFVISDQSQFYITFSIYRKNEEEDSE